jgi:transketolase
MRKALYATIRDEMQKNAKIISIDADLGKADGLLALHEDFPDRAFDVGIAEANMAGIAAGAASYGMIPIINTFAAFATRRICDQIAVSVCYANQNVKIIGTDPGIAAELNGGTHMALEDISVVRAIPNLTVIEAADEVELVRMTRAMINHKGPVYMRMYRKAAARVYDESYRFVWGKADVIKEGRDVSIIASGMMVSEAVAAGAKLSEKGIDAEIINVHMIKPIDRKTISDSARKTGAVVTAENHSVLGGLRSAVAETLTEEYPVRIYPIGFRDVKGEVGKLDYLKERFGLTSDDIVRRAVEAVGQK